MIILIIFIYLLGLGIWVGYTEEPDIFAPAWPICAILYIGFIIGSKLKKII